MLNRGEEQWNVDLRRTSADRWSGKGPGISIWIDRRLVINGVDVTIEPVPSLARDFIRDVARHLPVETGRSFVWWVAIRTGPPENIAIRFSLDKGAPTGWALRPSPAELSRILG